VQDHQVADRDDSGESVSERRRFDIRFPSPDEAVAQDEEFCEVEVDGEVRRIRFHDYDEVYSVPGLYEQLFYEELECQSPAVIRELFSEQLERTGADPSDLVVLDVGAGNGMIAEELHRLGVGSMVGVDIIEEAAEAADRDRPGLYEDYFVLDLTRIPDDVRADLDSKGFNCLTSVAALGFGDIPPRAFAEAYNLVSDRGWIAFTIKEDFLSPREDDTGFSQLIRRMMEQGTLELLGERRYRHRLSITREPLHYMAIVARKRTDVPLSWTEDLND
jgi:predicted TPR repeat methyltransferase